MENIRRKDLQDEISEIREIAKIEKVSMSFVLNVKNLLELKRQNYLYTKANVLVSGHPSALEKIAINIENL